jgi:hypothetical protein
MLAGSYSPGETVEVFFKESDRYMKTLSLTLAAGLFIGLLTRSASAQIIIGIESIGPLVIVPGQSVELGFPNVFDPSHPKRAYWEGLTQTTGDPAAGPVMLRFGWDDLSGGFAYSTPYALTPNSVDSVEYFMPFCPPVVSIHFQTDNPASYTIEGVFVHECVFSTPESSSTLPLAGLGILGLLLLRKPFGSTNRTWRPSA